MVKVEQYDLHNYGGYEAKLKFVYSYRRMKIGFLHVHIGENYVSIWSVSIKPEFRGKGFGNRMMKEIVALIRKTINPDVIFLHVVKKNTPAVKAYLKAGFKDVKAWYDIDRAQKRMEIRK